MLTTSTYLKLIRLLVASFLNLSATILARLAIFLLRKRSALRVRLQSHLRSSFTTSSVFKLAPTAHLVMKTSFARIATQGARHALALPTSALRARLSPSFHTSAITGVLTHALPLNVPLITNVKIAMLPSS
jgi:hypothetical protein